MGITPHKPLRRAYNQHPKAIQKWWNKEYPAIAQKARKEGAEIHLGDEAGLCNESYHGRSYSSKGQTPAIRLHSKCKRVNLISMVTNQGKVRFMVYEDKMNSGTLIKFIKLLIRESTRKIFLVLDNLKVHHSYLVGAWLDKHKEQIEVSFLPSYSPKLNPDEYLNCDLKTGVHSKVPVKTKEQLKSKMVSHLRKLQRLPEMMKNILSIQKLRMLYSYSI